MIEKGNNIPVLIKEVPIRAALLQEAETETVYGILIKDMYRYQEDIQSKVHLVDVLVNGVVLTFWRPITTDQSTKYDIDMPGFWEECTPNGRAFSSFVIEQIKQ